MIKLQRQEKPIFLTEEKVHALTEEFKTSKKSVWNNEHIKSALLLSSHGKCAYCECSLTSESNYMEVEHFEDKKNNPEKVVDWENLLPSCKKCNGSKSTHNVLSEPIINPYVDQPSDHLSMRLYRLKGKTEKGKCSIDVLNLNHSERLVMSRFLLGEKIQGMIETCWERYETYNLKNDVRTKNRLIVLVEGLLTECLPDSVYSASTATILLSDRSFIELIECMKAGDLWNEELDILYTKSLPSALECA